jgi:hypothetical protein
VAAGQNSPLIDRIPVLQGRLGAYRTECEEVVAGGYRGFVFG